MFDIPSDPDEVIDVYLRAAEENRSDALLKGSTLHFPNYGQLVMTGDLHGHRRNFDKLVKFCVLGRSAGRHVILHEMVHEEVLRLDDVDLSHVLLYEAAHWKSAFPEQVHFLQSNHDLAQLTGQEITKNGRFLLRSFEDGVAQTFGRNNLNRVLDAIKQFIASFAIAARTQSGIFMAHSLPSPFDWPYFDCGVFDRKLAIEDLIDTGAVYNMVWGRAHTAEQLEDAAEKLQADIFVVGHQPQETGYAVMHDRMLILASDHTHGVFLPINLAKKHTIEELIKAIRPFVSVL